MNKTYIPSSIYNGEEGALEVSTRYFKGKTEITYNFSDLNDGINRIVKIIADYNDNSPLVTYDYDYNMQKCLPDNIVKHIFYPIDKTDNIFYYPTFYIYFSNFKRFIYQTPFRITKESFYSGYRRLTINSAQFIDDVDNSIFLTLQTANGDILNSKIK